MPKLTPAQQRTYDSIVNAPHTTPDKVYGGTYFLEEDYISEGFFSNGKPYRLEWKGGLVYSRNLNSATLRCLEEKGLIKVHQYGGNCFGKNDIIEIL